MESLSNFSEEKTEPRLFNPDKIRQTNRILARLALWGLVTFGSLSGPALAEQGIDMSEQPVAENTNGHETLTEAQKAASFENRFRNNGLLAENKEHSKPVVVITTRENIQRNFSPADGVIKTDQSLLMEELTVSLMAGHQLTVVERDSSVLEEIVREVKFGSTGLVEPGEEAKLGSWTPADYYVLSAAESHGGQTILENEIIDLKSGSSVTVSAVSSESDNLETAISELTTKTEAAITGNK